jgi:phosphatidylserine decarboxylase
MQEPNKIKASWCDKLVVLPQYLIPHHILSVTMHRLTQSNVTWFKNAFIRFIVKQYKVNLDEAQHRDVSYYPNFNSFFTRELKRGVHQIEGDEATVVSSVDGVISQIGAIESNQLIQAKGFNYSLDSLLGNDRQLASQFTDGQFATIYLSPKDYHRIHMPVTGKLQQMTYIPGKLFSVSPRTVKTVSNIFARNERVVTVFDSEFGPFVVVLVGAIFVGSMETVWAGQITPPYSKESQTWYYQGEDAITIEKGQELGRFNMGSTIVLLLPKQADAFLEKWQANSPIRLGQAMT